MFVLQRLGRGLAVLLCLIIPFCFTGCSNEFKMTTADFLKPPRAAGEMYDIDQALQDAVAEKYTLKYPTAGKYRSAYILADLTGTGTEGFALAFYSVLNSENVVTMHLNLMKRTGQKWSSIGDISVAAVSVEKVEICDLDGDGMQEIVVGWNIYGVDKKVIVYSLKGLTLTPRIQEPYTDFICCDLRGQGKKDLFLLHHDVESLTASAKLYTLLKDGVHESGRCALDGAVTAFAEPAYSHLLSGKAAVYIDAQKGNGMQTEIIFYQNKTLQAPLSGNPQTVSPTYRESTIACMDINGDGCLDIPRPQTFPVSSKLDELAEQENLAPITGWYAYDGKAFSVVTLAMMNYADGYYMEIPNRWSHRVIIEMDMDNRERTVYLLDAEQQEVVSELVRLRTVAENEWEKSNNGLTGYREITRHEGLVYIAMFSNYAGEEAVTPAAFEKMVHLIS